VKTCYRCHESREDEAFIRKKNGTTYDMCSMCLSEVLSGSGRGPKKRLAHTSRTRICYLCRRELPNASFTRRSNGTYFSACKACNINVFAHQRRARLAAAEGTFTTAEWLALLARYPACPGCLRSWAEIPVPKGWTTSATRDHIVAISCGGRNDIGNLRPLCRSCNSRKGPRAN
jgi:5-methylcytosine-specific restriction endonuclease McrA